MIAVTFALRPLDLTFTVWLSRKGDCVPVAPLLYDSGLFRVTVTAAPDVIPVTFAATIPEPKIRPFSKCENVFVVELACSTTVPPKSSITNAYWLLPYFEIKPGI